MNYDRKLEISLFVGLVSVLFALLVPAFGYKTVSPNRPFIALTEPVSATFLERLYIMRLSRCSYVGNSSRELSLQNAKEDLKYFQEHK